MDRIKGKITEARECDHCREAIFILASPDERIVAVDQRNGMQHICFDIPADANLLVMRDVGPW